MSDNTDGGYYGLGHDPTINTQDTADNTNDNTQPTQTNPGQSTNSAEIGMATAGIKGAVGIFSDVTQGVLQNQENTADKAQARQIAGQNRMDVLSQQEHENQDEQERLTHQAQSAEIDKKLQSKKIEYDNWVYYFKQQLNKKKIVADTLTNMFSAIHQNPAIGQHMANQNSQQGGQQ